MTETSRTSSFASASTWLVAALIAVMCVMVSVLAAPPASAHDALVSSTPAADSELDALPAEIVLTFSADLLTGEGATDINVTDASGTLLSDGTALTEGNTVTQPLVASEATGTISVAWKVLSSDGHPTDGAFSFTVTAPAAPEPSATPSAEADVITPIQPAPTATADAGTPQLLSAEPEPNPLPWIGLGVAALAVIAGIAVLIVKRRKPTA